MVKSMYAFVRDAWKRPDKSEVSELLWNRMQVWRREGAIETVKRAGDDGGAFQIHWVSPGWRRAHPW